MRPKKAKKDVVNFLLRTDPKTYAMLQRIADDENLSINQLINQALIVYLSELTAIKRMRAPKKK